MSGHSHFKTIKAQKEIADAKKGKIFSKIASLITIAAKEGPDPASNSKLRIAIEQAKAVNMPKDNVERAIKRGTGELAGKKLEEVIFEGFGPGNTAIIVEAITDNKNRTLSEVKQIFNQNNGKLASEGAVQWMFERKGIITIDHKKSGKSNEQLELAAIESGAEDIELRQDFLEVYTKLEALEKVKNNLTERGIEIEGSAMGWVPKNNIAVDKKNKQNCQNLFESLDENEAVQEIYYNIKD